MFVIEDTDEEPGKLHRARPMEGCRVSTVFPDILSRALHSLSDRSSQLHPWGFPWTSLCVAALGIRDNSAWL